MDNFSLKYENTVKTTTKKSFRFFDKFSDMLKWLTKAPSRYIFKSKTKRFKNLSANEIKRIINEERLFVYMTRGNWGRDFDQLIVRGTWENNGSKTKPPTFKLDSFHESPEIKKAFENTPYWNSVFKTLPKSGLWDATYMDIGGENGAVLQTLSDYFGTDTDTPNDEYFAEHYDLSEFIGIEICDEKTEELNANGLPPSHCQAWFLEIKDFNEDRYEIFRTREKAIKAAIRYDIKKHRAGMNVKDGAQRTLEIMKNMNKGKTSGIHYLIPLNYSNQPLFYRVKRYGIRG